MLVYPGGDYEVHRPSWQGRHVDFGGRKGFLRLALEEGVPIVPVVSIGGQETALFLSRGERLAKGLALDRLFRLKVLPISIAPPWGINVGDMLGHLPLPAKITVEALPPIDLRREFGDDPDLDEVYDHLVRQMQETLDALAAERRWPVLGMRVESKIEISAPPALVWQYVSDPSRYLHFMSGDHALGGRRRASASGWAPRYRMLLRVGSAEVGGLIEVVEFERAPTSPGPRSPASTSAAAGGCAPPTRAARRSPRCGSPTASPAPASGAGSPTSAAAPTVRGHLRRSLQQLKRQVEHEQLRSAAAERRRSAHGRRLTRIGLARVGRGHGDAAAHERRPTARAAAPSSRPTKPIFSPVVNLTFTLPSTLASDSRIASRCGASFGRSSTTVASTWSTAQPSAVDVLQHGPQQRHRVGVAPQLVGVGEVLADVAQPGRAEQRVDDRVGEHVGVRVPGEAALARDLDPAEDQRAAVREAMGVDADAGAHQPIGSSRRWRPSNTQSSPTPTCSSSSTAPRS